MNALAAPTDLPPLPGGLVEHGQRRRDWAFHPLTGALELALAEPTSRTAEMKRDLEKNLLENIGGDAGGLSTARKMARG